MSPYRQSALRGAFSGYLFHGARRLAANAPFFVPPFAAGEPAFTRVLRVRSLNLFLLLPSYRRLFCVYLGKGEGPLL